MPYSVNRSARPYFNHVGQGKTPVLILDNFMHKVDDDLLHHVESLDFDDAPTYYPGIRAKLPDDYVMSVARAIVPLLQKMHQIPPNYQVRFFDSFFSLVTKMPAQLSLEQQIPHFDGTESYRFALLHYLSPHKHGGTAFYRHRPTGIERVDESNVDSYLSSVSACFASNSAPRGGYICNSNPQFEKLAEIPFVQNRMAIYPGNLLHSGIIDVDTDIDPNPASGRLTANIFLSFSPPA